MINEFNDVQVYDSGIIYQSIFEQIKKLHEKEPERAGELAISAIEMVLTGQVSTDDYLLEIMLETAKVVSEKKRQQYEKKREDKQNKKMEELKLAEIASLWNSGKTQKQIGQELGLTQQTVSYRMNIIKNKHAEMLDKEQKSPSLEASQSQPLPHFTF